MHIDEQALVEWSQINTTLVGRRMSWAATGKTTRVEDIAYCLLGIFDVGVPMLYGKGPRAFMRLQEEIVKTSNDLSLLHFLVAEGTDPTGLPFPAYRSHITTHLPDPLRIFRAAQV